MFAKLFSEPYRKNNEGEAGSLRMQLSVRVINIKLFLYFFSVFLIAVLLAGQSPWHFAYPVHEVNLALRKSNIKNFVLEKIF